MRFARDVFNVPDVLVDLLRCTEGKSFHLEIPLSFFWVMEFLGTLLWDLMIRFDERCFLLGGLKWVETTNWSQLVSYSVLNYLDPAYVC